MRIKTDTQPIEANAIKITQDMRLIVAQTNRIIVWENQNHVWCHTATLSGKEFDRFHHLETSTNENLVAPVFAAAGTIQTNHGQTAGAAIFRLDAPARLPLSTLPAPPPRQAMMRLSCPGHVVTCAAIIVTFLPNDNDPCVGSEKSAQFLAIGSNDGVIRIWIVCGGSDQGCNWPQSLPLPHEYVSDIGDKGVHSLAVCSPECELGILVGAYNFGAAMWQVATRTLLQVFGIEEPRIGSFRGSGGCMQAMANDDDATDSLARHLADNSSIPLNCVLGILVVDASLRWRVKDESGCAMPEDALAMSFAFSLSGCALRRKFQASSMGSHLISLHCGERCVAAVTDAEEAVVWDDRTGTLLGHFKTNGNLVCLAPSSFLSTATSLAFGHGSLFFLDPVVGSMSFREFDVSKLKEDANNCRSMMNLKEGGMFNRIAPHYWKVPADSTPLSQSLGGFIEELQSHCSQSDPVRMRSDFGNSHGDVPGKAEAGISDMPVDDISASQLTPSVDLPNFFY